MLVALGFAVLVLTVGMVVLFAMFGELSARVAQAGGRPRSTEVVPLEGARLGGVPDAWPGGLLAGGEAPSVLLVLSSACGSCLDIAGQLRDVPAGAGWDGMGVVVSTSHEQTGEEFVAGNGIGRFPHHVDVGGSWVTGQFGVNFSPSALVFAGGRLVAAYIFHDVAALRATVTGEMAGQGLPRQDREAV
ncbi:MAG: hypothetical protein JO132_07470 [Streptosporangiaceae bacterium]|nr:hypothetical protein [Streptosporangiaceae bacterium]